MGSPSVKSTVKHCSIVGAVAIASLLGWYFSTGHAEEGAPNAAAPVAHEASGPGRQFFSNDTIVHPLSATESKAAEIDRLSATGKPADAYKAYFLALACKTGRDDLRNGMDYLDGPQVDERCADITPLQIREMEKNLAKAVAAGIPGALVQKLAFGPLGGDPSALETRPNDPLVLEWKRGMLNDLTVYGRKTGDLLTLSVLENIYLYDYFGQKNPELALSYAMAQQEVVSNSGNPKRIRLAKSLEGQLARLSEPLTPEQIAAARAFAKTLAAECCSK